MVKVPHVLGGAVAANQPLVDDVRSDADADADADAPGPNRAGLVRDTERTTRHSPQANPRNQISFISAPNSGGAIDLAPGRQVLNLRRRRRFRSQRP